MNYIPVDPTANFDSPTYLAGIDIFAGMRADTVLFSLARGSNSLSIMDVALGRNLSPADIFISDFDGSFRLYASAESLGLLVADNIDGLDAVPEPAGMGLLVAALAALLAGRSQRRCRFPWARARG